MKPNTPMIITALTGGLGNQLFQYATGLALSQKLSLPLKMDISGFEKYKLHNYSLGAYQLPQVFSTSEENTYYRQENSFFRRKLRSFETLTGLRLGTYFHERSVSFQNDFFKINHGVYLDGYWQYEKYFKNIRAQLLPQLQLKVSSAPATEAWEKQIKQTPNAVSLHVRRGDYASDPKTLKTHGLCGLDYYERAVKHIESLIPNPQFFIFSDDHAWVKSSLKLTSPHFFIADHQADKNYEDLKLMSFCRHHVLANSSFSWWGAWLSDFSDSINIAPQVWVADLQRNEKIKDLIPSAWTRL